MEKNINEYLKETVEMVDYIKTNKLFELIPREYFNYRDRFIDLKLNINELKVGSDSILYIFDFIDKLPNKLFGETTQSITEIITGSIESNIDKHIVEILFTIMSYIKHLFVNRQYSIFNDFIANKKVIGEYRNFVRLFEFTDSNDSMFNLKYLVFENYVKYHDTNKKLLKLLDLYIIDFENIISEQISSLEIILKH